MLTYLHRYRFCRRITLAMAALSTLMFCLPAAAFGDGRLPPRRIDRHGAYFIPGRVHAGHYAARLPHRQARVGIGAFSHFSHPGRHYRPAYRGYAMVRPPVGAIMAALPLGFLTLALASSLYYYHGDVYYRPVAAGYLVVDPPRESVVREAPAAAEGSGGQVVVTAPRLNVRSGPGKRYAVIGVIDQGTSLDVAGDAPGWLYVNLGDGRHGWVQRAYTAPLLASTSG